MIENLFNKPQFTLGYEEKNALLFEELTKLTKFHKENSPEYERILQAYGGFDKEPSSLESMPFLPVSMFKRHLIKSIPEDKISTIMTSSGTTGQAVSRICLDQETASLQTKALSSVLSSVLGKQRLPMLIIDSKKTIRDPRLISARGAGVLGLMRFGRNHEFLLDDDMQVDFSVLSTFLEKYGEKPFVIFGFTFMAWQYLYKAIKDNGYDLSQGTLIHSGGWKKLIDIAVDNDTFKSSFTECCGLKRIFNFYGMVEQMGSIFLEGEDGYLYPPNFVDVLIRDPYTLKVLPHGEQGLIQVLSLIPRSYPGHSLLTEDLGVIQYNNSDPDHFMGHALRVVGRVPKSELRGCSDTHAFDKTRG